MTASAPHAKGCLGKHDENDDCYTSARGDTTPRPRAARDKIRLVVGIRWGTIPRWFVLDGCGYHSRIGCDQTGTQYDCCYPVYRKRTRTR